ncbi:MAG: EamA family transporter [Microgenomates group bacterium]
MNSISILLALLAFVGWGLGDTISIALFRKNDPAVITFFSGLLRLCIWLLLAPLFLSGLGAITLIPLLFNLLAGLGSGLGYYFYGKAAQRTNPALVAAIGGGWGGSALIYSLLFFKETLSIPQWISIALIFVGLFLVTFNLDWFKKMDRKNNRGFLYAFFSFLAWGVCGAFLKIPVVSYGWYWTSVIMLIPYILVLFLTMRKRENISPFKIKDVKLFIVIVIATILADLGYNSSFHFGGNIAIVGTIAGSYATLSTVLSYFIYKEPLTKKQTIGIIIALIGIISTSYFSSL